MDFGPYLGDGTTCEFILNILKSDAMLTMKMLCRGGGRVDGHAEE